MSLNLIDRAVDLQSEGFDAAICFAEQHKNADIIMRRIMQSSRVLCASPAYLKRCGTPNSFADLEAHNCLRIAGNNRRNTWRSSDCANSTKFEAEGNFEGNSTDVIYRATLAGIGIARLPCYLADQKFHSGELVHVMPHYSPPSTDIAVMFAERRNLAPKTRMFINILVRQFREAPEYRMTGS